MEESFRQDEGLSKQEQYERFFEGFKRLIEGEHNETSVLANTAAALHEAFGFFWTGFYLVTARTSERAQTSGESLRATASVSPTWDAELGNGSGRAQTSSAPTLSLRAGTRPAPTGCGNGDELWLTLGPFQGSVACWHIRKGKGVCGTAWAERRTQVVPDVDKFPGHIACSSLSRSEIVVPLYYPICRDDETGAGKQRPYSLCLQNCEIRGVLDIDSDRLGTFDETDRIWLERICELISRQLYE